MYFDYVRNEDNYIILQYKWLNYLPVIVSSNILQFRLITALNFTWIYGKDIRDTLQKCDQLNAW